MAEWLKGCWCRGHEVRLEVQTCTEVQGSAGLEENLGAVSHRSIVTCGLHGAEERGLPVLWTLILVSDNVTNCHWQDLRAQASPPVSRLSLGSYVQ